MELLTLDRIWRSDDTTIGILKHDGKQICFTLEDKVREIPGKPVDQWKVPSRTAIPSGEYDVVITMSNRFKRLMPLLLDVPGFAGVRIHSGNTHEDTEGCILLGTGRVGVRTVVNSKLAIGKFEELLARWKVDDKPGKCRIKVVNG